MSERERIYVGHPMVDLAGDQMANYLRLKVQKELIHPFIEFADLKTFDLCVKNRDATNGIVLKDAINAVLKCGCAVKTSSVTPSKHDVEKLELKSHWSDLPSAAGELRGAIAGTIFREALYCDQVVGKTPWKKKPIVVARLAYGGLYTATEVVMPVADEAEAGTQPEIYTYSTKNPGTQNRKHVMEFAKNTLPPDCVGTINHRPNKVVVDFAQDVLTVAWTRKLPIYVASKSSLSAQHLQFHSIFTEYYEKHFKEKFEAEGLWLKLRAPDVMVSTIMKSTGGFVVACQNYDGELLCPLVAEVFGSVGLMTAQTINVRKNIIMAYTEHGTIASHWNKHLKNGDESKICTNPTAVIGAWAKALTHLSNLDENPKLGDFASALYCSCRETLSSGIAPPDIVIASRPSTGNTKPGKDEKDDPIAFQGTRGTANTAEFILAVRKRLEDKLAALHQAPAVVFAQTMLGSVIRPFGKPKKKASSVKAHSKKASSVTADSKKASSETTSPEKVSSEEGGCDAKKEENLKA